MAKTPITIYDESLNPVADLENAYNVSVDKKLNKVGRASFQLPVDDVHYDKVQGRRYAEIFSDSERKGLYRILDPKDNHDEGQFNCQHVLGTLNDDMLVGVHSGVTGTTESINYVLDQQETTRWQLGQVDFSRNFHHRWKNRTLLYALFEIPDRYNEDYQWTFDTTSYPWTLNLIKPDKTVGGLLYYEKNAQSITRDDDFSNIITKLYAFGAGSGDDQVALSDSDYTDKNYVEDSTADKTVTRVWTDQRYTNANNLYAAAEARLEEKSTPDLSYSVDAVDIFEKTGNNKLEVGKYVTVKDSEMGVNEDLRINRITKRKIWDDPQNIQVTLANKREPFPDFGNVAYADDLDQVKEGANYSKVYSTQVDAGEILLSAIRGGELPNMPETPSTAGLYLGAEYLGYHDSTQWVTYMDNTGKLILERPSTGASVKLLPSGDEGLVVTDDSGNQVLKALIGGADIGDVVIGQESMDAYAKFDKSAGEFNVRGILNADDLKSGTIDFNAISKEGLEVLEAEIADGAIGGIKIKDGAVSAPKLNVDTLSAVTADMGSLTSGHAEFAGGDVQIGDGVASDGSAGILVQNGGVMEVTDGDGDVIFNTDGVFTGYDKHGSPQSVVYSGFAPPSWTVLDMSSEFGDKLAMVMLRMYNISSSDIDIWIRQNNDTTVEVEGYTNVSRGVNVLRSDGDTASYLTTMTDENGKIEWGTPYDGDYSYEVTLMGYILMG